MLSQHMRQIRTAVFLTLTFLLALPGAAAQSFLIAPPRVGPAPNQRGDVRIAASSEEFLTVWHDGRQDEGALGRAWAARVSRTGQLLDATGLPIGDDVAYFTERSVLSVASNGTDFLIATRGANNGVVLTKVTRDGIVQRAPALSITAYYANLVSLGDSYALFYNENLSTSGLVLSTRGKVIIVDRDGHIVTAPVDVVASSGQIVELTAAMSTDGINMLLLWIDGGDGRVHARAITTAALKVGNVKITSEIDPTPANPSARGLSVVAGGDRYFASWIQGTEYRGRVISTGGSAIGSTIVVASDANPTSIQVAWNGSRFVAAYASFMTISRVLRIAEFTPNGIRSFDATPNTQMYLSTGIAAAGSDSLVVWESWSEGPDDRFKIRADLYDASSTFKFGANPLLISRGATARRHADGAWMGSNFLATWIERSDAPYVAIARFAPTGPSLDGAGIFVGAAYAQGASVASDGHDGIVGWAQVDGAYVAHVSASGIITPRRITADGFPSNVDVVFNGEDYAACSSKTIVRLYTNGTTKQISTIPQFNGGECHLEWSGSQYLLTWTTTDLCFPVCIPPTGLWAQAISKELTPLGGAVRLAYPDVSSEPQTATAGDRTLVVWSEHDGTLRAKRITANGVILDASSFLIGEASQLSDVFAEGENWIVVSGPYAWTVTREGNVGARQTRFPFIGEGREVTYVAAPVPFLIYQAPDAGLTPQLYGRFLESLKRRGARH